MWQAILGIPEVGVETSFYELGGHSLLALQVFNGLHEKYKVRLPLSALVENSTIRALASYLRTLPDFQDETPQSPIASTPDATPTQRGSVWNTVVPFQKKGDLPPFFCVAGLGGNPMNFRELAGALGTRQPFYAFQHSGVDGVQKPHGTIEAMAAEFISDMRRVQPKGPYYIGGFSFGGLAAYEMIQQLLTAGDVVGGLVLLDSSNPDVLKWSLRERIRSHRSNIISEGPAYLKNRAIARFRYLQEKQKTKRRVLAAQTDSFTYRVELVTEMSIQAERRYEPAPLAADVVLLKSEFRVPPAKGIGYPPHESNGWRSLVAPGKLDIRLVSSSHLDMVVAPYVAETAQQLSAGLAMLRGKARACSMPTTPFSEATP
jgi:thioesterase domain-containing protein/acyl carrier protein